MDTVNNIASAASKAIWGEAGNETQGVEPRSGATGDVSAGQPYDLGNETVGEEPRSGETGAGTAENPYDKGNEDQELPSNTVPSASASIPAATNTSTNADETAARPDSQFVSSEASVPVAQDTLQQEGANQPLAAPKQDIESTSGQVSGLASAPSNDMTKGTGQEHVPSSGVAAVGGDFDAAKPGAGREATRLLDTTSENPAAPVSKNTTETGDIDEDESGSGGKLSQLKDKIKAKLHISKKTSDS